MSFPMSRRTFLATGASASFIALHPFAARATANQAHLRIMETTDLHVHVFPYDYYGDRAVDTVGLSRTAALIEDCLLYTSPSPRDQRGSRMPSSA